jgi:hypothetical protein
MRHLIEVPVPHLIYAFRCFDEKGELVWTRQFRNLVTTQGLNYILATGAVTAIAKYVGLVDGATAPTFAAGDTLASHAGWTENTGYSQTARPTISWGSPSGGSVASSAAATFSITASGTIAGAFTADNSAIGGTTGNLYSEGAFSAGNAPVAAGYTLDVSLTMSV